MLSIALLAKSYLTTFGTLLILASNMGMGLACCLFVSVHLSIYLFILCRFLTQK